MQATVIFSLGATNPFPPSTWRGTMVKAVAADTARRANVRREIAPAPEPNVDGVVFFESFMLLLSRNRMAHGSRRVIYRRRSTPRAGVPIASWLPVSHRVR